MYDQIQTALTIMIEVIALIGFIGLPTLAIANHHINTVRSWGTPQSMPIIDPVVEVEPKVEPTPEPETIPEVVEVEPALELIVEPISLKRVLQSVGAAGIDIQKMTVRELRDYCKTNKIKGYSKVLKEQGVKGLRVFVEKVLEESRNSGAPLTHSDH
jgi:hypothetical protein